LPAAQNWFVCAAGKTAHRATLGSVMIVAVCGVG
jgi:hypothetical protein